MATLHAPPEPGLPAAECHGSCRISSAPGSSIHEAYLPAESDQAPPDAWVPGTHEDPGWSIGSEASPGQGAEATHSVDSVEARVIPSTGPFPREVRIRRPREFREISGSARRHVTEAFVVLVSVTSARPERMRLGVTVSRKVGNAVTRNRVKRLIREWFRRDARAVGEGRDLVVIARPAAARLAGRAAFVALTAALQGEA